MLYNHANALAIWDIPVASALEINLKCWTQNRSIKDQKMGQSNDTNRYVEKPAPPKEPSVVKEILKVIFPPFGPKK